MRAHPAEGAEQVTEALPGEPLEVIQPPDAGVTSGSSTVRRTTTARGVELGGRQRPQWAQVRTRHDRHAGWVPAASLGHWNPTDTAVERTVTALRAHAYAGPRIQAPIVAELCLGARVWLDGPALALGRPTGDAGVRDRDGGGATGGGPTIGPEGWQRVTLAGGATAWVGQAALAPLPDPDVANLAMRFLDTPYVWGGRSAWGLDCSGLVQLVFGMFGIALPRDADQQQAATTPTIAPRAGDLAFFPGHVGIMLDARRMIHANATYQRVTIETLGEGSYGSALGSSCLGYRRARRG